METGNVVINKNINLENKMSILKEATRRLNRYNQFQISFWIHRSYEDIMDELDEIIDEYNIKRYELAPGLLVNFFKHAKFIRNLTDELNKHTEIRNLASIGTSDNYEKAVGKRIFTTHMIAHQIFCQKYASHKYKKFMLDLNKSMKHHKELFSIGGTLKDDYEQICRSVDNIISALG